MQDIEIHFDPASVQSYERFLAVKALPRYRIVGRTAFVPAEYADRIGVVHAPASASDYESHRRLFDYQRDIVSLAIRKGKFAIFADCGLGKTLMLLEYARHVARLLPPGRAVLIVSPLMVVGQTIAESIAFYGVDDVTPVAAADLGDWLTGGHASIGITNYEALSEDIEPGRLGALILDESSMLKSAYGSWAGHCIRLGRGLDWKLCLTGTPAPNDRIEYANHAVFLDQYPTVNAFLARFFVNRGQTDNRWELKAHALKAFYRSLSDWSIFLTNPATYGWRDNCGTVPPIRVHVEAVGLTDAQRSMLMDGTGEMFVTAAGGITKRSRIGQIAKGSIGGVEVDTLKPAYIRDRIASWPNESTIIWCIYNHEQDRIAAEFPDAANIDGSTPHAKRVQLIDDFKAGRRRVLISKGKVLGFGLNLQIATRHVFSGLQDSYETFYQCVKRSNRIGSTRPLNVHIPITEAERPMIETVLEKAKRVEADTAEQESLFREAARAAS